MWLPFLPLSLTGSQDQMPELTPEEYERREQQRQKDIDKTKSRSSYLAYLQRVPKAERDPRNRHEHPKTPETRPKEVSRRAWQHNVNRWRARLKQLYVEHEGTEPSDTTDPTVTADGPESQGSGGRDYDLAQLNEDMEVLALQGRVNTPSPYLSYADLVRRNAAGSSAAHAAEEAMEVASEPEPEPEPETEPPRAKRDWADYSDDESLPPFPKRHTWADAVRPAAKQPAWASIVKQKA